MADKTLTCKDCNMEFVFSEGEQAFYREKGFENEPQRCPECRKARKAQRRNAVGNGYSGTGSRNSGRSFGGGARW